MRITTLEIRNLRNIEYLRLDDLPSLVTLAGQNGVGKSTVLEAIRIWKNHATGPYGQEEPYERLFQLIRSGASEAEISVAIAISPQELGWLTGQLPDAEADATPGLYGSTMRIVRGNMGRMSIPFEELPYPPGLPFPNRTVVPKAPIFDYYGPNRFFTGSAFSQLNKGTLTSGYEAATRLPLPEYQMKRDVKSYLYEIDQRLADRLADHVEKFKATGSAELIDLAEQPDDFAALRSLLNAVLPDVVFSRVQRYRDRADNVVAEFLFRVRGGHEVPIDQLSSGEKEVLMTLLELFRTAPHNSIIMIDEPELHLNASIEARVIPYLEREFVECRLNQVFIATHSTAMLGRVPGSSLFKISFPDSHGGNQGAPIGSVSERTALLRDLVGDLSVFTTAERFVFIEGESIGKSIDKRVFEKLFPDITPQTIFIPAGNFPSVQAVAKKVEQIVSQEIPFGDFFAIRDRDRLTPDEVAAVEKACRRLKVLPRCMIENYLLDEEVWIAFLQKLGQRLAATEFVRLRNTVAVSRVKDEISSRLDHYYRSHLNQHDFREATDFSTLQKLARLRDATERAIIEHDALKATVESRVASELGDGTYVVHFDGKGLLEGLRAALSLGMPMHELAPLLAGTMHDLNRVPEDLTGFVFTLLAS